MSTVLTLFIHIRVGGITSEHWLTDIVPIYVNNQIYNFHTDRISDIFGLCI